MQPRQLHNSYLYRLAILPSKALRRLRSHGWSDTWRRLRFLCETRLGDWRYGIRAGGFIPREQLGHDPECVDYDPISHRSFQFALSHVEICPQQDVFLDFGCGMGRALILAARRPFAKVMGVEKSPELCEIAKTNVARAAGKLQCREIEICHADARTFVVPDEVTVIYLFNPFTGSILAAALDQIAASLNRRPRRLMMLYVLPVGQYDPLAAAPWLKQVCDRPTEGLRFVMYEHLPESEIRKPS